MIKQYHTLTYFQQSNQIHVGRRGVAGNACDASGDAGRHNLTLFVCCVYILRIRSMSLYIYLPHRFEKRSDRDQTESARLAGDPGDAHGPGVLAANAAGGASATQGEPLVGINLNRMLQW